MYRINTFLNIIIIMALLALSYLSETIDLEIFIFVLCLSFPKIRHLIFRKPVITNLFYEITETIINLYLIVIITRAIFDPVINFNHYEVMMYSYFTLRLIYIILILIFMNLLLMKTKTYNINLSTTSKYNYIFTFFALGLSILNFGLSRTYSMINILFSIIIIICLFKLLISIRENNDDTLFLSIVIGILSILVHNPILVLLPLSISYNKYQNDVINT